MAKTFLSVTIVSMAVLLFPLAAPAQIPTSILDDISNFSTSTQAQIEEILSSIPTAGEALTDGLEQYMEIITRPKYPDPYEKVSIEAISFLTDLNRAEIFWYVNDKLKERGVGKTRFSFSVGGVRSTSIVDLVIKTTEGKRVDKQISFRPVELSLLWEANTYTPPFYKGRALISPEGALKVVALPNFITAGGTYIPAEKLVYVWKKDGEVLEKESGYGKRMFYIKAPIPFWDTNIEVEVSSLGGSLKAGKSVNIFPKNPKVIFYRDNPLGGVQYENAVGGELDLSRTEIAIKAEPYFFSVDDMEENLVYSWSMDDRTIEGDKERITFRQEEEGGVGISRISLAIQNLARTYQSASRSFLLNFKSAGSFNF
ncbi:MAG: hypothetical protein BMS9Abin13_586 [Patescibacteria group bacterium]|nr:MAG: hypothetical protein BMS9Abin13_586 [Patescibacteria group bacterium]